MLALTFLVLFLGNFLTTLKVVHQKVQKNQDKVQKKDWEWNSVTHLRFCLLPVFFNTHNRYTDWPRYDQARRRPKWKRSSSQAVTTAEVSGLQASLLPMTSAVDAAEQSVTTQSRVHVQLNSLLFSPVHSGMNVFCFGCLCQIVQLKEGVTDQDLVCLWRPKVSSCFCEVVMVRLSLAWTKLVNSALDLHCFLFVVLMSLLCHFTANQYFWKISQNCPKCQEIPEEKT